MQRQCCFRLQLVVSVVFPGPVYWSGGWACGEQAQFQDVFKGARVRGNGIVFGHAELICHARDSLAVRDGGVLSQYRQFLRAGWKSRRPRSVYAAGGDVPIDNPCTDLVAVTAELVPRFRFSFRLGQHSSF